MNYYTLQIGTPRETGRLNEAERFSVVQKTAAAYESFTLVEAKRYRHGRAEDFLLVRVATDDARGLAAVADGLRRNLSIDNVVMEAGGRFEVIAAGADLDEASSRLASD